MSRCLKPASLAGVAVLASLLLAAGAAAAQNPLGIGSGEAALPSTGMFSGVIGWINAMQQDFYRSLTGALRSMRENGGGTWLLVGLSFAYGVFHAAGPGHGKAVISSYMLANETALRRGIVLSFLSALMQGTMAVTLIGLVFLFLRGTTVSMTDASRFLEIASYALVAAFGAYLLLRKLGAVVARRAPAGVPAAVPAGAPHPLHRHDHRDPHRQLHGDHRDEYAATLDACPDCGHSHAPDPNLVSGGTLDWRSAWTAVAAVGLRPCSGALIVLTFAFLNELWVGGLLSVLAMSLGTAITVSLLATLAVTAKNLAMRMAGGGNGGRWIHDGIEIAGAALIMVIGLLLLSAGLGA